MQANMGVDMLRKVESDAARAFDQYVSLPQSQPMGRQPGQQQRSF
jgi:hypothetical protein